MDRKSRGLLMANLYFKNKDYNMAEKCLLEHLDTNPEDSEALRLMAQIYESRRSISKAFEMHERRYLLEPARTGAILDICRVLLMSEVPIENVDYKKWYELGKEMFGMSNPIIKNMGELVQSTVLPTTTIQHHVTEPKKENYLSKILDRLQDIEDRLARIELKLPESSASPDKNASKSLFGNVSNTMNATSTVAPIKENLSKSSTNQNEALKSSNTSFNLTAPKVGTNLNDPPKPLNLGSPKTISGPTVTNSSDNSTPKNLFGNISSPQNVPLSVASLGENLPKSNTTQDGTPKSLFGTSFNLTAPKLGTNSNDPPKPQLNLSGPNVFSGPNIFGSSDNNTSKSLFGNFSSLNAPLSFASISENLAKSNATQNEAPKSLFGTSFNLTAPKLGTNSDDSPKPLFSSFSTSKETTKPLFSSPQTNDDKEDDLLPNDVPIENFCQLKPIDQKTGEEDDDVLMKERCKLYRLVDGEYKERGLDEIKVLKNRISGIGRLVMRQQLTGKVCLNCFEFTNIVGVTNDKMIKWAALDNSDNAEVEARVFIAKFKTKELADTFKKHLIELSKPSENSAQTFSEANKGTISERNDDVQLVDPVLNQNLVNKARELKLPDLFYHDVKYNGPTQKSEDKDD